MPDICKYYQAIHLGRLIDCCWHQDTKVWSQLEQAQSDIPFHRSPCCYQSLSINMKHHPLIGPTTRLCLHLFTQASLSSPDSQLFAILGNPLFTLGYQDATFQKRIESGFFQASHFLSIGNWPSIPALTNPIRYISARLLESSPTLSFSKVYTAPWNFFVNPSLFLKSTVRTMAFCRMYL